MKGKIYFRPDDAPEEDSKWNVDITEGVQVLYDWVIASKDWGSGFWTYEDAEPVAKLAKLLGFDNAQEVQDYVDARQHSLEQQKFIGTLGPKGHRHYFGPAYKNADKLGGGLEPPEGAQCQFPECKITYGSPEYLVWEEQYLRVSGKIPHDHVYSSVGKCMWPACKAVGDNETD